MPEAVFDQILTYVERVRVRISNIFKFSEKRKGKKRQQQPIIQTAKSNETFFGDAQKRPTFFGVGNQMIRSQIQPMQMQMAMQMPMPMSIQMSAFAAQNRMLAQTAAQNRMLAARQRQPQEKVKPAPTNVPSGKVYSKKEMTELEKRRHGVELRQVRRHKIISRENNTLSFRITISYLSLSETLNKLQRDPKSVKKIDRPPA